MKNKIVLFSIIVVIMFFGSVLVSGQQVNKGNIGTLSERDKAWFEANPDSLPIWLTAEELERIDEIGLGFEGTDAPPAPVRMPAEFEPMQGVLIRYPFGISYQIIAEMSEDVEVVTIVASTSEQSYVYNQYQSHGVNVDNCDFLIAPSDSYWTRDYGPWFIFTGDDEQGIADFIYNRPRPNDNLIPVKFGNEYSIPVYGMSLEHTGGNYMTDGQGIAVSTNLVWTENSGYTHSQIEQIMQDYCGIDTYHVVADPNGEYIKHVDCWGKYLTPDTILIREVPSYHSQYDEIESTVDYFESQTSCYGTPYNVVRVYTPGNEPYTNSLILNNKVLVPVTGSQWDDEALDSYETAMPGYEVLGFTGSWVSTDALHCRAKGIVDRYMLYIEHTPLYGTQSSPDGYEIQAMIYPYSGEDVNAAEIFYRIGGESWQNFDMEYLGSSQYRYVIPQQTTGTVIDYYIHAEDDSGRTETHPYIGAPMAHSFTCELINDPPQEPDIDGPLNGNVGVEYEFTFFSTDPDENDVFYFIDWGDGTFEDWFGPFASGTDATASHTWTERGTYNITAKAKDIYGAESDWGTLEVTMPKNQNSQQSFNSQPFLFQFLQRFLGYSGFSNTLRSARTMGLQ